MTQGHPASKWHTNPGRLTAESRLLKILNYVRRHNWRILCGRTVCAVGAGWGSRGKLIFVDKVWLFLPLLETLKRAYELTGKENEDLKCTNVGPQYAVCFLLYDCGGWHPPLHLDPWVLITSSLCRV